MLNKISFNNICVISKFTFTELYRSKIFFLSLILGICLLGITFVAFSFTYGEALRVSLDFGVGMLSLSSCAISLFMGGSLISKEIDNRTIYMIISRPVSRESFLIGKICGLSGILIVNVIILAVVTLSMYFIVGGEFQPLIVWNVLFIIFEALLLLLIVLLCSLMTNSIITVLISISIYVIGHSLGEIFNISMVRNNEILRSQLEIMTYILPSFFKFNIKDFLLYKTNIGVKALLSTSAYFIFYSSFITCLILAVFKKKSLD